MLFRLLVFVSGACLALVVLPAAPPFSKSPPAGSCHIEKPFEYCVFYDQDYVAGAARADCTQRKGNYSTRHCPSANRQGSCLIKDLQRKRTFELRYYQQTWAKTSYLQERAECLRRATPNYYTAIWQKGDPQSRKAPIFDPDSQYPYVELGSLENGQRVLAPREGTPFLFPAMVVSQKVSHPECAMIRYADQTFERLYKWTRVKRLDWFFGTEVVCRASAAGNPMPGTISDMSGSVWRIKADSELVRVLPRYCRDQRKWIDHGKRSPICKARPAPKSEELAPPR